MQPLPGAIVPPLPEVGVDALPRRKVARQHPPLDAAHSQVEYRIDHQTHIQTARSSPRFGRWNQMLDIQPLAVGQICGISFCFHKDNVTTIWPSAFTFQTASKAIDCLGDPEHYIAFVILVPHDAILNLALLYPEKGIVIHYFDLYTTDQIHPYLRIRNMSVGAPGTTEEVVQVAYSDSQLYGYSACLRKPWPGSFESIEVASPDEFSHCLPKSLTLSE